jgi:hypothetical protein
MLRTKLAAAAAHWNRRNQWDGNGAYDLRSQSHAIFAICEKASQKSQNQQRTHQGNTCCDDYGSASAQLKGSSQTRLTVFEPLFCAS